MSRVKMQNVVKDDKDAAVALTIVCLTPNTLFDQVVHVFLLSTKSECRSLLFVGVLAYKCIA